MAETGDPQDAFDTIVRAVDVAMAVVTVAGPAGRGGCLVGFHGQSSIDPLRYSVWISKANHTHRLLGPEAAVAVHFPDAAQHQVAEHFGSLTGDEVDKLADVAVEEGPAGALVLTDVPRWVILAPISILDLGGDHVLVEGPVADASADEPFLPFRLAAAAGIDPGHDS